MNNYVNDYANNTPAAIDDLVAAFQHLPSWEKRYLYLIELGKELPSVPRDEQCGTVCFKGCQSSVWLTTSLQTESDCPCLRFQADSDSKIVRGLIAILSRVYDGQPADFILQHDINELFTKIELKQHLDAGRRNGLHAMEMHIKDLARHYA
ncbi:cysteine desulfuration protein SufE [bacterium]|nr:MAG: cysteine desulfuration protein SufE [bacterium]